MQQSWLAILNDELIESNFFSFSLPRFFLMFLMFHLSLNLSTHIMLHYSHNLVGGVFHKCRIHAVWRRDNVLLRLGRHAATCRESLQVPVIGLEGHLELHCQSAVRAVRYNLFCDSECHVQLCGLYSLPRFAGGTSRYHRQDTAHHAGRHTDILADAVDQGCKETNRKRRQRGRHPRRQRKKTGMRAKRDLALQHF